MVVASFHYWDMTSIPLKSSEKKGLGGDAAPQNKKGGPTWGRLSLKQKIIKRDARRDRT